MFTSLLFSCTYFSPSLSVCHEIQSKLLYPAFAGSIVVRCRLGNLILRTQLNVLTIILQVYDGEELTVSRNTCDSQNVSIGIKKDNS